MLMMLRDLGIKDQIMYSLTQYANRRPDGKYVRLWGTVRDMGVTDRKRPQFMAVKLANYAMVGDMMETFISGNNPTWDQPMSNGVQLANAHYIQSYAFSDGVSKSLLIFNLHRTDNLQVNFAGINAPSGPATMIRLSSGAITDNNEDSPTVGITSQAMDAIDPTQPIWLPPYSLSLIQWKTQ